MTLALAKARVHTDKYPPRMPYKPRPYSNLHGSDFHGLRNNKGQVYVPFTSVHYSRCLHT